MKTVDYENKYKKALQRAKDFMNGEVHYALKRGESIMCWIFPELIESEDERIRKWIINEIKIKHHNLDENNVDFVDKAIAWLERQGEQKSGNVNVDKMVMEYSQTKDGDFGLPVKCMIKAYEHGINDVLTKQGEQILANSEKNCKEIPNELEECEIEHGKYYYCIKDYYAGGNKRASKGDVVQALNGMSMMALGVNANEYFMPVNNIEQKPAEKTDSGFKDDDFYHPLEDF